jgi:hypothetical protein
MNYAEPTCDDRKQQEDPMTYENFYLLFGWSGGSEASYAATNIFCVVYGPCHIKICRLSSKHHLSCPAFKGHFFRRSKYVYLSFKAKSAPVLRITVASFETSQTTQKCPFKTNKNRA